MNLELGDWMRLYYVLYREKKKSDPLNFMLVNGNGIMFTKKALRMLGYVVTFCDTKNAVIEFKERGKEQFKERYSTSDDSWNKFCEIDLNENFKVMVLEKMFENDKREMYEKLVEKFYGVKM